MSLLLTANICYVLINKLRVTSYKLSSLRVVFIAWVSSYFLQTRNKLRLIHGDIFLWIIIKIMSYFYCTSYDLLLMHELRVSFYIRELEFCLLHKILFWIFFVLLIVNLCLIQNKWKSNYQNKSTLSYVRKSLFWGQLNQWYLTNPWFNFSCEANLRNHSQRKNGKWSMYWKCNGRGVLPNI